MNVQGDHIYVEYDSKKHKSLALLTRDLLDSQISSWEQLRIGHAALSSIRERQIEIEGQIVTLQCNPQRIKSAEAIVEPDTIKARPCFLCPGNLPCSQKGILYNKRFLILANPFPIFPRHFTVSHIQHLPQSLQGVIEVLLMMAEDFQPEFTLLYNGPQCGASAPDHLHFQAVPKMYLPSLKDGAPRIGIKQQDGVALFRTSGMMHPALIVESDNRNGLAACLNRVFQALKSFYGNDAEPMLNLFCYYEERRWRVIIYPRRKHRPAVYYENGEEQILVSPGAIDMAGVLVIPREVDFHRLNASLIMNIMQEVSLSSEEVARIASII